MRGLLYGDVNLNLIDGSAIWATSMAEAMAQAGVETTFVLKSRVVNDRLVAPLHLINDLKVIDAFGSGLTSGRADSMSPKEAVRVLIEMDEREPFDFIVVRGRRLSEILVRERHFNGRIWCYLTDIPQSLSELTDEEVKQIGLIAQHSQLLLCQTEDLRSFLESQIINAKGKCRLWPPVVPIWADESEGALTRVERPKNEKPWRLVYLGKFAPRWNTESMTALPAAFRRKSLEVELHMVGDKIHDDRSDPDFASRMRKALESTKGVVWHGGMGREEAMRLAATMHFGLSWRDPSLDSSLELSTKVLEFGLLGVPPILNRTPMHEELFGSDYPLFANNETQVVEVVRRAIENPAVRKKAIATAKAVSASFGIAAAVDRLREYLSLEFPPPVFAIEREKSKLRVLLVSHDWKFFARIEKYLRALPGVEVRVDHWASLNSHDEKKSHELIKWADVVICEWAGPNAVWYSQNKRANQRLIVRLHRFELGAAWLDGLRTQAVDQFICVSEPYAKQTVTRLAIEPARVSVIPNYVDDVDLDRPKLAQARFHLGLLGAVPKRKRLDRALDVLEALRRHDDRYLLMVKTEMPWDLWWVWRRDIERDYFAKNFARINGSPNLRGGVVFDPYGPDVALWLRRVGWVLSTSDDESFHLAPAEGMASGAVPLITGWQGSDAIYSSEWIFNSPGAIAKFILSANERDQWQSLAEQAKRQLSESFGLSAVLDEWGDLIKEQALALGS